MRLNMLIAVVLLVASAVCCIAQGQWNHTIIDPTGDAQAAFDITQASLWHDGSVFHAQMKLASPYATGPYTVYGVRIRTQGAIYGLAFVTEQSLWGPKLGVSYDNGSNWGFASGSPGGSISPTEVNLQIPMSNIGPKPWDVDLITGVWWYFNSYEIRDSTTIVTVPASVTVDNVTARQRTDGSHRVDIYYDIHSVTGNKATVTISVSDNAGASYSITPESLSGDVGTNISTGTGKHIVWDAGADLPGAYDTDYKIMLSATN